MQIHGEGNFRLICIFREWFGLLLFRQQLLELNENPRISERTLQNQL